MEGKSGGSPALIAIQRPGWLHGRQKPRQKVPINAAKEHILMIFPPLLKKESQTPYSICVKTCLLFWSAQMDRVTDPADPRRCQGTAQHGQCPNFAEHGSSYCRACGGECTRDEEEKRSFLLAKLDQKRKLARLEGPVEALSRLHDDILILEAMQECITEQCNSHIDVSSNLDRIDRIMARKESLLKTLTTVGKQLDELLPRAQVMGFADYVISVVIDELKSIPGYEQQVDRISDRIFNPPKQLEAPNV